MRLEDIQKLWDADSIIDRSRLDEESAGIPLLHSKYYKIYVAEKNILTRMLESIKILSLEKREHYTQGASKESLEKGWKLPPRGAVLKTEADFYLDADTDLIGEKIEIAEQNEKVEFLKSVLKMISDRQWHCRVAIDFMKFKHGG